MPFFQYYQTEFINILNIIKERLIALIAGLSQYYKV